jgi:hypothetical protein
MIEGWITVAEMQLIADQMTRIGPTGTILEIGSAAGRLFSFLYPQFPNWKYVAVDPWEHEHVQLQKDWSKDYFAPDNLGELITKSMFVTNCPFAEAHQSYFEDWCDSRQFDIISMGLINKKIKWHDVYQKASKLLADNGVIASRNLRHSRYGEYIEQAVKNLQFKEIAQTSGSKILQCNRIRYGSHLTDLDIDYHSRLADTLLQSSAVKKSGMNNLNSFVSVTKDVKQLLSNKLNLHLGATFDWNFEYFKSGEPAGLHTDYVAMPNSWRPKDENTITHDCHIVIGVIIPLEWNCNQPYTVNYDRVSAIPRKLIYRKGEMRYMDNDEIVEYRTTWQYDTEVLKYNPKHTQYYREYADLKLHSVYEWSKGTMMIFDTARWHSSSWFLTSNTIPSEIIEYKKSIIGFGSIDVDRNLQQL